MKKRNETKNSKSLLSQLMWGSVLIMMNLCAGDSLYAANRNIARRTQQGQMQKGSQSVYGKIGGNSKWENAKGTVGGKTVQESKPLMGNEKGGAAAAKAKAAVAAASHEEREQEVREGEHAEE